MYDDHIKNQIIIKGEPFEINKFEKERERLFLLFKNNGIYNFQQNSIQFTAAIDSSGKDLNITAVNTVFSGGINVANLPTSDPGVAGRLYRSGNDVKVSTG